MCHTSWWIFCVYNRNRYQRKDGHHIAMDPKKPITSMLCPVLSFRTHSTDRLAFLANTSVLVMATWDPVHKWMDGLFFMTNGHYFSLSSCTYFYKIGSWAHVLFCVMCPWPSAKSITLLSQWPVRLLHIGVSKEAIHFLNFITRQLLCEKFLCCIPLCPRSQINYLEFWV